MSNKFPQEGVFLAVPTQLEVSFPDCLATYDLHAKLGLILASEQHITAKSQSQFVIAPVDAGKVLDEPVIEAIRNLNDQLVTQHNKTAATAADAQVSIIGYINSTLEPKVLVTDFLTTLTKKTQHIADYTPLNLVAGQYVITLKDPKKYSELESILQELAQELQIQPQEVKDEIADNYVADTMLYKNNIQPEQLLDTIIKQVTSSVAAVAASQAARRILSSFHTNALKPPKAINRASQDIEAAKPLSIAEVLDEQEIAEQLVPDLSDVSNAAEAKAKQQQLEEDLSHITEENDSLSSDIWEVLNKNQDAMHLLD